MRLARESVKLQFDNVGGTTRLRHASRAHRPDRENPAIEDICDAKCAVSKKPDCGKVTGRRQYRTAGSASCGKSMISGLFWPVNSLPTAAPATLTKTGRSRISRAIVRDGPALAGGGSFGPSMARFGLASISGLNLNPTGKLPGQRRTTREADLSTQQTGAQAPSRLPRPPRDHRRPQGSRRPSRPRP